MEAEDFLRHKLEDKPRVNLSQLSLCNLSEEVEERTRKGRRILEGIREASGNHPNILRLLVSCYVSLDIPQFNQASVYVNQLEKTLTDDESTIEIAEFYVRWSTSVKMNKLIDPLEEIPKAGKVQGVGAEGNRLIAWHPDEDSWSLLSVRSMPFQSMGL